MARAWPARDVAPLVALIADPRHTIAEDGTIQLTEEQAKAILDLRLQRLTALGRDEIGDEVEEAGRGDQGLSRHPALAPARARHHPERARGGRRRNSPRRALTELVDAEMEIEDEALIEREDVAITVTHAGYIKRTPLAEYRVQGRGGKGRAGMATREEDFVTSLFVASTHAPLVFFSSTGMAYKLKVWRLPEARISGQGQGDGEPVAARPRASASPPSCRCRKTRAQWEKLNVVFATKSGDVRRNELSDFVNINRSGKIAMKLEPGDGIVGVAGLHRPRRRPAHHPAAASASASRWPTCACSRGANPPACAASSWPIGRRRRRSGQPDAAASFRRQHRRGPRLSQAGQRRAPRRHAARRKPRRRRPKRPRRASRKRR